MYLHSYSFHFIPFLPSYADDLLPVRQLREGSVSVWCSSELPLLPVIRQLGEHWAESTAPSQCHSQQQEVGGNKATNTDIGMSTEELLPQQHQIQQLPDEKGPKQDQPPRRQQGVRGDSVCPLPSYGLLMAIRAYYLETVSVTLRAAASSTPEEESASTSVSASVSMAVSGLPFLVLTNAVITYDELFYFIDIILAGLTTLTGSPPRIQLQSILFPEPCEGDDREEDQGEEGIDDYEGGKILASLFGSCQALHLNACVIPDTQRLFARVLSLLCGESDSQEAETLQAAPSEKPLGQSTEPQTEQQRDAESDGTDTLKEGRGGGLLQHPMLPLVTSSGDSGGGSGGGSGGSGSGGAALRVGQGGLCCPHLTFVRLGFLSLSPAAVSLLAALLVTNTLTQTATPTSTPLSLSLSSPSSAQANEARGRVPRRDNTGSDRLQVVLHRCHPHPSLSLTPQQRQQHRAGPNGKPSLRLVVLHACGRVVGTGGNEMTSPFASAAVETNTDIDTEEENRLEGRFGSSLCVR